MASDSNSKSKKRGRPLGEFAQALSLESAEYLATLSDAANVVNADVMLSPSEASIAAGKIRREILQHYQGDGGTLANETRKAKRTERFERLRAALNDPKRNLNKLSDLRAAELLSREFGLSLHTLRKDIVIVRKLTEPTL